MKNVRVGIIGLGNMGRGHISNILQNKINGLQLTAVADSGKASIEWAKQNIGTVDIFQEPIELITSPRVDAVLICTPHFSHPELAMTCFQHNKHVLIEKPAGVYTKQVRAMNDAAAESNVVFSIMYNQRTNPLYQKLKHLVQEGELGEIKRTNWIVTNWYRPQSYYDSSTWRATWAGEGSGVLLNQVIHQLDLWQWTIDMMPKRLRAFCYFGKGRSIEVENEVTAYVEYENGASGIFVTSTAEAPGTNRFEIAGTKGKVVLENDKLMFSRLRESEPDFNARCTESFGTPECWTFEIPIHGHYPDHCGIIQNWVNAIQHNEPLIAPGEDGLNGVMLANAMLLSTWQDSWIDLPLDDEQYWNELKEKMKTSDYKEAVNNGV